MLNIVKRFFSTQSAENTKLLAGFVRSSLRSDLEAEFRKGGIDQHHPLVYYKTQEGLLNVVCQGTSTPPRGHACYIIDDKTNLVGSEGRQFVLVPTTRVILTEKQVTGIKHSEEFIINNEKKIINAVKALNPKLLKEQCDESHSDNSGL